MGDQQHSRTEVRLGDFAGLKLEVDERKLDDGGSHDIVNIAPEDVGSLKSRRGVRVVTFEDD